MNQDEAFQVIVGVLKKTSDLRSKVSLDHLKMNTQLRKEMGFDSLSVVALFCELQDQFPHLQEEMVGRWLTLGDCASSIIQK